MPRSARGLFICLLTLCLCVSAANAKTKSKSKSKSKRCAVCTQFGIDMPISLAAGTVTTPKFHVVDDDYSIAIQAQWSMPTSELQCRMGFAPDPSHPNCSTRPLIDVQWRVYDGSRIVSQGIDNGWSNRFDGGQQALRRYIGFFHGQHKHKYVVELTFIKNASMLDVAKPHLIVAIQGPGS